MTVDHRCRWCTSFRGGGGYHIHGMCFEHSYTVPDMKRVCQQYIFIGESEYNRRLHLNEVDRSNRKKLINRKYRMSHRKQRSAYQRTWMGRHKEYTVFRDAVNGYNPLFLIERRFNYARRREREHSVQPQ